MEMKINLDCKRRMVLFLLLMLFSIDVIAQSIVYAHRYTTSIAYCYQGSWSNWSSAPGTLYLYNDFSGLTFKGSIDFFSFRITNYAPPSKKEIKQHLKTNTWYEYRGIVEYYVNDTYPTANDIAKYCTLVTPDPRRDVTPHIKRTCSATIKIAPYKKTPECYNIWFDNIGIGINMRSF